MTDARCDTTELLVDQCACPTHRGSGQAADEDVATIGQPFEAAYSTPCARGCDGGITPCDSIARCWDAADGYVHAGRCP